MKDNGNGKYGWTLRKDIECVQKRWLKMDWKRIW